MLPWGAMLRAALQAGVSMDTFWTLSLREWRWLASGAEDARAISRESLTDLMTAFPDSGE